MEETPTPTTPTRKKKKKTRTSKEERLTGPKNNPQLATTNPLDKFLYDPGAPENRA